MPAYVPPDQFERWLIQADLCNGRLSGAAHRTGHPDKAAGADVRFDWKTGRRRGVELDRAPFNATVVEVFRTFGPPHEVIITQQVIRTHQET